MKKLLLLSALVIFACSSDDSNNDYNNNNDDDATQLFLEKYDGVMWGDSTNSQSQSFWLTLGPTGVSTWSRYDDSGLICDMFSVAWGEVDSEGDISTIQEETEDSLIVAVESSMSMDYTITLTVSTDGNSMTFVDSEGPSETNNFIRDNDVTTPPDGC